MFGSYFPEQQLVIQEKKDVDDSIATLVTEIEQYIENGDLESANTLLEENKEALETSLINSTFINLLQEEIFNIGLLAISQQNVIINANEPTTQITVGSYWVQDFN